MREKRGGGALVSVGRQKSIEVRKPVKTYPHTVTKTSDSVKFRDSIENGFSSFWLAANAESIAVNVILGRKTDEVKELESNLVSKIGQNARNPLGMLLGAGNQQQQQQQQQQILHQQQQGGGLQGLQSSGGVSRVGQTPSGAAAPPATCQLCLKTKFADGVGHICNYCNVSSFSRVRYIM
ncbi:hypothetical protein BIW11_10719 [Tropilaelaps mercedesae]|uniref:RIM zinc finger domain-containing protein n=1 Tax=Tropilaelaps mercedesae TaxID=418985 RepID=A0A1V9XEN3_9ACAR|nr:hypothetical protein BIW11_10719 [Tropilaelaps mercedesae]